ncbi:peptide ABC transporter ATP-binding protein [Paenibacillus sp. CCS19]|uniref:ABC transporter ATP-binding protein n=1 Tax=Paenibacillus sp. CCS19 TaxID=3158387 RepID=UPI00256B71E7|nr:ABC transporter ATP-binding protein [Paenibacillus cellulosilyticus]GMK38227.1 peptide ABC transporter ATP-binding protein [Paenibacillus cellulosilyticus]
MSQNDNEVLIEIEKLVKTYRMGQETVQVLRDVDLIVRRGEFLAIVGPSGSGKSTMMNIIGCLDIASSGSYKLDGVEVKGLSDNKLANIRNHKIGFIFQGFQLLPKLTAIENVELPLVYRGMSNKERRKKATEALRKVGLEDRMFHRPSELSGGQQQRVAIARALAGEPPMLLADEPTGALDTRTGQEVLALMEQLHQQGHTIVLITHDMEVAARAERVVRMKDGVLTEEHAERRETLEAYAGISHGV